MADYATPLPRCLLFYHEQVHSTLKHDHDFLSSKSPLSGINRKYKA